MATETLDRLTEPVEAGRNPPNITQILALTDIRQPLKCQKSKPPRQNSN